MLQEAIRKLTLMLLGRSAIVDSQIFPFWLRNIDFEYDWQAYFDFHFSAVS